MPKLGDDLILKLLLDDGNTAQFVRASLYDENGAALAGSPVDLTHIENGYYQDNSLTMPSTQEVTAIYKVYSDAGHTTLNPSYPFAVDTFVLDDLPDPVVSVIQVNEFLVGVLEADELVGVIDETNDDLIGIISEC